MSISRYHGQVLEITVIGCTNLKDLEWFSKQDPYVCIEYGSSKFKTRTCTDGGRNPRFQERFLISLIDGVQDMSLLVWNSNTLTPHQLIGSGKIQLDKLITQGIDDRSWTIFDERSRAAGEVKLFMYCPTLNQPRGNTDPPPRFSPSPSLNYGPGQMPPHIPQAQPVDPCNCHSQRQYQHGMYPDPSHTTQQGSCPHHHRPYLQHSYSAPYPSQYYSPPAGSSYYPPGPPYGSYPPDY